MDVLLDTNFLMIPHQFHIDLAGELDRIIEADYNLTTLSCVVDELEKLSRNRGDKGAEAKTALKLIKEGCIRVLDRSGYVDDEILNYARENRGVVVCTNDVELRRMLRRDSIPVICMQGKSTLAYI